MLAKMSHQRKLKSEPTLEIWMAESCRRIKFRITSHNPRGFVKTAPFRMPIALCLALTLCCFAPINTHASAQFGWFYYQIGDVTTKVDGISEYSDAYYPAGYDLLTVDRDLYFQIGMDMGGRWVYDVISTFIFNDNFTLHELDYGLDESFCNLKGGIFHNPAETHGFGYGMDMDWRVNKYRDVEGATPNTKKIRVGFGPNAGFRLTPYSWISFFPNVSGYFYPWPNEDYAFIPKTFDSFGYRAEFPLMIDLNDAFTDQSKFTFVISVMPFIGSKSGFHSSNDQTGEVKKSTASVNGIKFGLYGWY